MALYLPEKNVVFLHIPKCGGFWVEEALLRAGVSVQLLPNPQDPLRADRHANLEQIDRKPDMVCAFIRHPLMWYESWWKYSAGKPHNWDRWDWHPTYPLQTCRHFDFNEFIERVLAKKAGFLTRLYAHYLGDLSEPLVHMIGRVERMADDFLAMLRAIGVEVDPDVIRNLPPQNPSYCPLGSPVWREDQEQAVLESEKAIINRWYRD